VRRVDPRGDQAVVAGTGDEGVSDDGVPAGEAAISLPTGVAVADRGNLYMVDYDRVRKVDPKGTITTVAGMSGTSGPGSPFPDIDGSPATSVPLGRPWSLAVDAAGVLYVADAEHDRVYRVDAAGIITTVAGAGAPADDETGEADALAW
jgi:serine/threonine-protein kinase